jgi:hypothetical protein
VVFGFGFDSVVFVFFVYVDAHHVSGPRGVLVIPRRARERAKRNQNSLRRVGVFRVRVLLSRHSLELLQGSARLRGGIR